MANEDDTARILKRTDFHTVMGAITQHAALFGSPISKFTLENILHKHYWTVEEFNSSIQLLDDVDE